MKPLSATVTGIFLATGLAWATPSETPEGIARAYLEASDTEDITAHWQHWHPEAVINIAFKYGLGQPDDTYVISAQDWTTMPEDQAYVIPSDTLQSYEETHSTPPTFSIDDTQNDTQVTAVTKVDYTWEGYQGQMTRTDNFNMTPQNGSLVIRTLTTTYDYR